MKIPDATISIECGLFTRSVQALVESFGMNAENLTRHMKGEALAYGEEDFIHLNTKYNLDDAVVDNLLSASEIDAAIAHFAKTPDATGVVFERAFAQTPVQITKPHGDGGRFTS